MGESLNLVEFEKICELAKKYNISTIRYKGMEAHFNDTNYVTTGLPDKSVDLSKIVDDLVTDEDILQNPYAGMNGYGKEC